MLSKTNESGVWDGKFCQETVLEESGLDKRKNHMKVLRQENVQQFEEQLGGPCGWSKVSTEGK